MKQFLAAALFTAAFLVACAPFTDGSSSTAAESAPRGSTFAWMYEASDDDGIPRTALGIEIRHPDGTVRSKGIDDIEGGCDEHPEPDDDVYEGSTMILCYYAGLGRQYKIVESGGAYVVQRRIFEEASPGYDPPVRAFETIAEL